MSEILENLDMFATQAATPSSYHAEVAVSSNPREVHEQPSNLPPVGEGLLVAAVVGAAALSCLPDFLKHRNKK